MQKKRLQETDLIESGAKQRAHVRLTPIICVKEFLNAQKH